MTTKIEPIVQAKYAEVANSGLSTEHGGVRAVAEAFGYTPQQLAAIPAEANMGLSCGNPTAFASLRPGETVVDLGSGGGLDVFLAAKLVGETGRAIGIDMTPDMIALAERNAIKQGGGRRPSNIEFHLAKIDALPLPDASVDCIISNCVVNLAPDKNSVFAEMARILKTGGRVAISDLALKNPLPAELAENVAAYVACIAGAISIDDYRNGLKQAGFADVEIIDSGADLNAYAAVEGQAGCCSPAMSSAEDTLLPIASGCCEPPKARGLHADLDALIKNHDLNDFAASVKVFAVKGA